MEDIAYGSLEHQSKFLFPNFLCKKQNRGTDYQDRLQRQDISKLLASSQSVISFRPIIRLRFFLKSSLWH